MPPRYTYWTIIVGGLPTAFRAREQDSLLPTLKQLQAKHPDAVMKWFARGRLWNSPEEAREALVRASQRRGGSGEKRGRDWRPGGQHRDPRDRFKRKRGPHPLRRRRWNTEGKVDAASSDEARQKGAPPGAEREKKRRADAGDRRRRHPPPKKSEG